MGNSVLTELARRAPVMKTISLPRSRHPLHIMPTSAGYELRTNASYSWDGRRRGQTPFTVLQYCVAGAGNLRYGRRSLRVEPGETLLLTIPHDHRYWVEDGGRWEFFWISMNGQEALRIHRNIIAAAGPILKLQPATIGKLAASCLALIDEASESPGRASAIAYQAAMALHDDVFGSRAHLPDGLDALRRVADHIESHMTKPLSVDDLAAIAGMSRAHFSRLFTRSEGVPPAEYVLQHRMRRAAKLLTRSDRLSIKEVATAAGFPDSNYFAKSFRRVYGASPSEFRTTGMYASEGGRGA